MSPSTVKRYICLSVLRCKNKRAQHLRAPSVAKVKDRFLSRTETQFSYVESQSDAESTRVNLENLSDYTYQTSVNQLHSLKTAIELHLEMGRFLNYFGSYLVARIDLDMHTDRKNRYRGNIRDLILMPHYFEDGPTNNVILICQRQQHLEMAQKAGCFLYGFEDVLKRFQAGDILDYNYDYLLCTPDVYPSVLKCKKKISPDRFPTMTNGRLITDVKQALERFTLGKAVESSKIGEAAAMLRVNFGKPEMTVEQLCENFTSLINAIEKMHETPNGNFVQFARISLPPSTETFAVALTDDVLIKNDEDEYTRNPTSKQMLLDSSSKG